MNLCLITKTDPECRKILCFIPPSSSKLLHFGEKSLDFLSSSHDFLQAEISLCRVYKRAGVEDHPSLPRALPTSRASSSRSVPSASTQSDKKLYPPHQPEAAHHHHHYVMERFQAFGGQSSQQQMDISAASAAAEKMSTDTDGSSSCSDVTTVLGLSKQNVYRPNMSAITGSLMEEAAAAAAAAAAAGCTTVLFPAETLSSSSALSSTAADEFHRLLTYQQASINQQQQYYNDHHHHHHHPQFAALPPQSQPPLALNTLPAAFSDRLWEWNPIPEANNREYNDPFK